MAGHVGIEPTRHWFGISCVPISLIPQVRNHGLIRVLASCGKSIEVLRIVSMEHHRTGVESEAPTLARSLTSCDATSCRESNPVPTLCTPIQQPVGVSNPRFMTENHESYR